MAKKNIFKNHALTLAKSKARQLIIERNDGIYYICDGFSVMKIPEKFYDEYVRPVNPVFVPLEDGQKAIKHSTDKEIKVQPGKNHTYTKDIFDVRFVADVPGRISNFVYTSKRSGELRIAIVNGDPVAYNRFFLEYILEYAGEYSFLFTNEEHPVFKYDDGSGFGALLMPVYDGMLPDRIADLYSMTHEEVNP